MAALLERLIGAKADELRKRMERSITVSKKLIAQLEKTEKAMNELTTAIKSWGSKIDEILHETKR